ncbi:nuclear transport factor 2 family protein [Cytobacillus praedii]|uniref:nuclear transport factor 2 family protein n=1 Tax=Cytobacillus praedii TaxID=1742358 RepID=UPI002E205214|nr:nuclear transport factor 2 family protein [Cytobacillus praedii]
MNSDETKQIIDYYVEAYNSFDVEGIVKLLHKEIMFRNFSNGEVDTETKGIQEFKELAENSSKIFANRRQTIVSYSAIDNNVEVQIQYEGILAVDLPNGLKAGDKLQLKGKSVFQIKDGKILLIEDYS